jgi:hypothetical protein
LLKLCGLLLLVRDMSVSIEWMAHISMGKLTWKPKVFTVGGVYCIKANPNEFGFVAMTASKAWVPDVKSTQRPSLVGCEGYHKLKQVRNAMQAREMESSASTPKKSLFADEQTESQPPSKKQKPNTHGQTAKARENPQMFQIELRNSDDEPPTYVWLQRPIKHTDDIVMKLEDETVMNVMSFISSHGITVDDLTNKRAYGSSGEKNVWKFGNRFYKKDDGVFTRVGQQDDDRGDEDDVTVDPSELPDAEE